MQGVQIPSLVRDVLLQPKEIKEEGYQGVSCSYCQRYFALMMRTDI